MFMTVWSINNGSEKTVNSVSSSDIGEIALDEYLQSFGDDLAAALEGAGRTLLINVDNVILPVPAAHTIGRIVLDLVVNGLKAAMGKGAGIVQIACGVNRDGGLTLEITDEGADSNDTLEPLRKALGATLVPGLVSQLDACMTIETAEKGLRCTIVMPMNAA
jgi:two-component sensor histidine kinase